MNEERPDRDLATFVLAAIQQVERYNYRGRRHFLSNVMTRDATLWNLHTLLEACGQLSPEVKVGHPDVDWRGVADFRNVLAHDILGISPRRVWEVITHHLPPLKRQVSRILATLA